MIRILHVHIPTRTLLLAASDALLAVFALVLAMLLRAGRDAELVLLYEGGIPKILIVAGSCLVCLHYYDLYDLRRLRGPGDLLTGLIRAFGAFTIFVALLFYFFPALRLARGLMLMYLLTAPALLLGCRSAFRAWNRCARFSRPVVMLGDGPLAHELAAEIAARPELGLEVTGVIGTVNGSAAGRLRRLGDIDELETIVARRHIHRVVLTMAERRGRLPVRSLLDLKTSGVLVEEGADVYEAITGRVPLASLRPTWLLLSNGFRISRGLRLYKRATSIMLSAAGLLASAPAMALIALAIRLDSAGPIMFRQQRIGKHGAPFTIYKFRTMRADADPDRPADEDDCRCTRVGRWLRRLRLDELPQLYNVLRGDMYFIGPRPFTVKAERELAAAIPLYNERWSVKPGLTGWAQIHRGYCATLEDNLEKLSYDLFYIKNVSIGLDCLILFETIKILLWGRGAR